MQRVGVLAYGSLIEDPGKELNKLVVSEYISDVQTRFSVEFARSSSKRDGARVCLVSLVRRATHTRQTKETR